jgi:hypothetical protein
MSSSFSSPFRGVCPDAVHFSACSVISFSLLQLSSESAELASDPGQALVPHLSKADVDPEGREEKEERDRERSEPTQLLAVNRAVRDCPDRRYSGRPLRPGAPG